MSEKGTLFVTATPIGNLDELSPRAVDTLKRVALIACEDTRTSSVLLRRFAIDTPLMSCHKFNESRIIERVLAHLSNSENVALISDAGTPAISDPGALLVAAAVEAGYTVSPIAGPCAAIAALSLSGFAGLSFAFYGFLPKEAKKIDAILERAEQNDIAIFYVSPHRIADCIERIAKLRQNATICLCNDLTKRYERIYRGRPEDVLEQLKQNPGANKGEYTLVMQNPPPSTKEPVSFSIEAVLLDDYIKQGGTLKDAAQRLTAQGLSKNALFDAAVRLKNMEFS